MPPATTAAATRLPAMQKTGRIILFLGVACGITTAILRRVLDAQLVAEPGPARTALAIVGLVGATLAITGCILLWRADRCE